MKHFAVNVALCCLVGSWIMAFIPTVTAEVTPEKLPEAIKREVDFDIDIDPIFQKHCYACHGEDVEMNGYSLWRQREAVLGGYSGQPAIMPGDSKNSRLIHLVAGREENLVMPPSGGKLTPEEIGILRAWIDQGVQWSHKRQVNENSRPEETQWLKMDYGPIVSAAITVREPEDPRADKGPDDNVSYKSHAIKLPVDPQDAVGQRMSLIHI